MGVSGLAPFMTREGILSKEDCDIIIRETGRTSAAFAKGVIALGLMSESQLAKYINEKTSFPFVDRSQLVGASAKALSSIDVPLLQHLEVIPVAITKTSLTVAMVDPLDTETLNQLKFFTDLTINPAVATLSSISHALRAILGNFEPEPTELEGLLNKHITKGNQIAPSTPEPAEVEEKQIDDDIIDDTEISEPAPTISDGLDLDDDFGDVDLDSDDSLDDLASTDDSIDVDSIADLGDDSDTDVMEDDTSDEVTLDSLEGAESDDIDLTGDDDDSDIDGDVLFDDGISEESVEKIEEKVSVEEDTEAGDILFDDATSEESVEKIEDPVIEEPAIAEPSLEDDISLEGLDDLPEVDDFFDEGDDQDKASVLEPNPEPAEAVQLNASEDVSLDSDLDDLDDLALDLNPNEESNTDLGLEGLEAGSPDLGELDSLDDDDLTELGDDVAVSSSADDDFGLDDLEASSPEIGEIDSVEDEKNDLVDLSEVDSIDSSPEIEGDDFSESLSAEPEPAVESDSLELTTELEEMNLEEETKPEAPSNSTSSKTAKPSSISGHFNKAIVKLSLQSDQDKLYKCFGDTLTKVGSTNGVVLKIEGDQAGAAFTWSDSKTSPSEQSFSNDVFKDQESNKWVEFNSLPDGLSIDKNEDEKIFIFNDQENKIIIISSWVDMYATDPGVISSSNGFIKQFSKKLKT